MNVTDMILHNSRFIFYSVRLKTENSFVFMFKFTNEENYFDAAKWLAEAHMQSFHSLKQWYVNYDNPCRCEIPRCRCRCRLCMH